MLRRQILTPGCNIYLYLYLYLYLAILIKLLLLENILDIAKKLDISDEKFITFLKEIQKCNPDILIEGNIRKELQNSLNAMKEWYNADKLNTMETDGSSLLTAICLIKDLVDFSEELIRLRDIKDPLIALGADSGQNKMIITLSIFDQSDLERDYASYSQAGTRTTLVIASCDGCKENPPNFFKIWNMVRPWELQRPFILVTDGKLGNMSFGRF